MRLFVAVRPPPDEVERLDAVIGTRDDRLRWVPTEQWHLTLVFCGEVAETVVPELTERLARAAARTPVLSLRLAGGGTFPNQVARARVLWVGVDGDTSTLSRLAERCSAAARRCGITVEDRPFRPHLTVARSRRDPVNAGDQLSRLKSHTGEPWTVTTMHLVQSTIGAKVTHQTLASFDLDQATGSPQPH